MYPDQVRHTRERQQRIGTVSDGQIYRRQQADLYLATRFRYRFPSVAEQSAILFWVEHGGRRPWGI